MILSIVYLVVGLVLILVGANILTDGASAIARRLGISDLVVGLTVVAFGTSAPELVISVMSAVGGSSELAVGNVVGSNIFNILMIIGVTAMVVPVKIGRSVMVNEIPLVLLSSAVLLVMGNSVLLDNASSAVITRVDGILLLLFFAIFMRYTFSQAKTASGDDPAAQNAAYGRTGWPCRTAFRRRPFCCGCVGHRIGIGSERGCHRTDDCGYRNFIARACHVSHRGHQG